MDDGLRLRIYAHKVVAYHTNPSSFIMPFLVSCLSCGNETLPQSFDSEYFGLCSEDPFVAKNRNIELERWH